MNVTTQSVHALVPRAVQSVQEMASAGVWFTSHIMQRGCDNDRATVRRARNGEIHGGHRSGCYVRMSHMEGPSTPVQQLHLVGVLPDGGGVVLSPRLGARTGAFVIEATDALVAAVVEAARAGRRASPAVAHEAVRSRTDRQDAVVQRTLRNSGLSVREIQARLRAGLTEDEVAAEAGVEREWVERFSTPIRAERALVVERVLPLVVATPRKGASSRPLAASVRWHLIDRGIRVDDATFAAAWSASLEVSGRWSVRFALAGRGRPVTAEWDLDADGVLVPRGRAATELGFVPRGAKHRPAAKSSVGLAPAPRVVPPGPQGAPRTTAHARKPVPKAATRGVGRVAPKAAAPSPPQKPAPPGKRTAQTLPKPAPVNAMPPPAPAGRTYGSPLPAPLAVPAPARGPITAVKAGPLTPAAPVGAAPAGARVAPNAKADAPTSAVAAPARPASAMQRGDSAPGAKPGAVPPELAHRAELVPLVRTDAPPQRAAELHSTDTGPRASIAVTRRAIGSERRAGASRAATANQVPAVRRAVPSRTVTVISGAAPTSGAALAAPDRPTPRPSVVIRAPRAGD